MSDQRHIPRIYYRGPRHRWLRASSHAGDQSAGVTRRTSRARSWLGPLLLPGTILYQTAANAARHVRTLDAPASPAGVTVVSVGNIEVGGNAKTPMAMHLVAGLSAHARVVYLSRGYGGRSLGAGLVTVVAADRGPAARPQGGVRYLERDDRLLLAALGDEGAMVADRVPHVPIVVGSNKARALDAALNAFAPDYVVLDDAFQSWGVPRDVDVVMVNAQAPFGDEQLLPAGRLRENPEALERADLIGVDGAGSLEQLDEVRARIQSRVATSARFSGVRRTVSFVQASGEASRAGIEGPGRESPVVVLSGIARPERFESMVAAAGWRVVACVRHPDHARYSPDDVGWTRSLLREHDGAVLVVTEKDWVKLRLLGLDPDGVRVARMELQTVGVDPVDWITREAAGVARGSSP